MIKDLQRRVRLSRKMALLLRHRPELGDLTPDRAGWVDVSDLRKALDCPQAPVSLKDIEQVVIENDKQRYTLSKDGRRIRAAQGHSFKVDLGLPSLTPPDLLWHGTATHSLNSIYAQGLIAGKRQSVHLSKDIETALRVGARHGSPIVLKIEAVKMHSDGHVFHQADNGVWLTQAVPVSFLSLDTLEQEYDQAVAI